ncbi:cpw-wpc domain-containing protein [Toxoplasma gondii RUB]|uniref:Cpw-wpc domain-containing protein n=8 Tax=Toxoplasma gondii TaxID=5811 RepID=B9QF27_TOXGV|nr:cpw-wpc domain-containing protein [Toxoplasma gondii VEG]KFG32121.1 cpw-wpc domain-containing protein [Toxoplasma gondii GAB2-2007-GAL-DOM2]KFG33786.1 cpw-wpc domain-containing protein [Toxoplasma gondii p89]KFG59077.1 cpw-wpc domain-containing protein [Toxoplasma gondii RUB]KFH00529.1 cpw-wpc domain-containing protein [Toxoplasma gondii VAND]KFH08167.1 cpw-wpc domain-containing protein [Toxoplasma gondii MAS]PUA85679.1 cpw-wpc domain-containing protein [Toxoplasma gondii TgCATBr9]RQX7295
MARHFVAFSLALAVGTWREVAALNPLQMMKTSARMGGVINDIADEFKLAFDTLPSTEQLEQTILHKNAEDMEKLDAAVANEAKRKPTHLCEGPSYKRDYSAPCPAGWQQLQNGQCWGRRYRGPCEALHFLSHFSEEQKTAFENNCCAYWPEVKAPAKYKKVLARGPVSYHQCLPVVHLLSSISFRKVEPVTGDIIAPKM